VRIYVLLMELLKKRGQFEMDREALLKEPFNTIIAGVGGQGNVLLSEFIGMALVNEGYTVSVVDTYGVTQRGGSVTSHIKVSKGEPYCSITLEGKADLILGMEPIEALRALGEFGNPHVISIVNARPLYPSGGMSYPNLDEVKQAITKLSLQAKFVKATEEALKMGSPIYTNIVLLGSLVGAQVLPISKETVMAILTERFPGKALESNMKAFNKGMELIKKAQM
jgi:indolepyruvate ferredoxin oxidoreductase beta subunit